jgi:predicted O-linked N-acetylglucosamine transferase (SPINDLY family)
VRRAVQLGSNQELIAAYHSGLRVNLVKSPLMDAKNYMQELENGYAGIWENFCTI